jgi:hypothetical protein
MLSDETADEWTAHQIRRCLQLLKEKIAALEVELREARESAAMQVQLRAGDMGRIKELLASEARLREERDRLASLNDGNVDALRDTQQRLAALREAEKAGMLRAAAIANEMTNLGSPDMTAQHARIDMQIRIEAAIRKAAEEA